MVVVWDWRKGRLLAQARGHTDRVGGENVARKIRTMYAGITREGRDERRGSCTDISRYN